MGVACDRKTTFWETSSCMRPLSDSRQGVRGSVYLCDLVSYPDIGPHPAFTVRALLLISSVPILSFSALPPPSFCLLTKAAPTRREDAGAQAEGGGSAGRGRGEPRLREAGMQAAGEGYAGLGRGERRLREGALQAEGGGSPG